MLIIAQASAADVSATYFGVNDYSKHPTLDSRAGRNYVEKLNGEINYSVSNSLLSYSQTIYSDSKATAATFKTAANGTAQTVFAFAGHGYAKSTGGPVLYDGLVSKTSLKFKHNYVVMYTCNWLFNGGSTSEQTAIYNTFNGTRLQMGFATQMYLDSRDGVSYGQRLSSETVGSSFVNSARIYQPQNSKDVVVKVTGHKDARMDYIASRKSAAPAYNSSNASSFVEHFNVTIPSK